MKGMPHLYYATGVSCPTRWIGDTLVVAIDPDEVLRDGQAADGLPGIGAPWSLPRAGARRLSRIRRLFAASGV